MLLKGKALPQDPLKPSSQHKGELFAPEGHKAGNEQQRQEVEDEEKVKGAKERDIFPGVEQRLPLVGGDGEEPEVMRRKMAVCKGKGKDDPVLGRGV